MAIRTVDPIGAAITATEKEIAGAAWDIEDVTLDETGDRTVETMGEGLEGQHEPDDDDDLTEGDESEDETESEEGEGDEGEATPEVKEPDGAVKPAVKAEAVPEADRQGRVPSGLLREARAERDALKAAAETQGAQVKQLSDTLAQMQRDLAELRRAPQPAAKPAETVAETKAPDFFEDPAGFIGAQTKPLLDRIGELDNRLATQRVESSMALAHATHKDAFTKAFEAVSKLNPQNPDDRATVQRIYANPNPGEALVMWHKRTEALREVGDDPTAYAEKVRAAERERLMKDPEFRKSLIEGLQAEASTGANGKPRTEVRLPRSLNGAAGGNRRDATVTQYDDNDQAIAEAAWR